MCPTYPSVASISLTQYRSIPIEQIEKNEVERIGTHSDFISITLLLQDDAGGLEAEDPKNPGTWIVSHTLGLSYP